MQLTLFENDWEDKANNLIDSLNENRKGIDMYLLVRAIVYKGLIIIQASNNKSTAYNILNETGDIPLGFSACWRSLKHIEEELKTL